MAAALVRRGGQTHREAVWRQRQGRSPGHQGSSAAQKLERRGRSPWLTRGSGPPGSRLRHNTSLPWESLSVVTVTAAPGNVYREESEEGSWESAGILRDQPRCPETQRKGSREQVASPASRQAGPQLGEATLTAGGRGERTPRPAQQGPPTGPPEEGGQGVFQSQLSLPA